MRVPVPQGDESLGGNPSLDVFSCYTDLVQKGGGMANLTITVDEGALKRAGALCLSRENGN